MLKFLRRKTDGKVISIDDASQEYAFRTRETVKSDGRTDVPVPAPWEEVSAGTTFDHLAEDAENAFIHLDSSAESPLGGFFIGTYTDGAPSYTDVFSELDDGVLFMGQGFADAQSLGISVAGDAFDRLIVRANGSLHWGDGVDQPGTSLERYSSGGLKLQGTDPDGSILLVAGAISEDYPHVSFVLPAGFPVAGRSVFDIAPDAWNGYVNFSIDQVGSLHWGDGTAVPDTSLARIEAGLLGIGQDGGGLQLKSPDGTAYNVTVTNDGTLDVAAA